MSRRAFQVGNNKVSLIIFLILFLFNQVGFSQPDNTQLKSGPTPARVLASIGKGANGNISELALSKNGLKLYVGGSFSTVDSSVAANNIAYILEAGGHYYWNPLGTGVTGVVNAICEYNGKIFVGGEFAFAGTLPVNNIAYYDGINWFDAGCIYGVVYDLVEFNGDLYSAGDFDVCTAPAEVNFAKLSNGIWQQIMGIDGSVNTLEVVDTNLFLGGKFKFNNVDYNVLKWNANVGFQFFNNTIANEVKDFEMFHDTMYAVCKRTDANDSNLILKLVNNTWIPCKGTVKEPVFSNLVSSNASFNSLCAQVDTLMVGGLFSYEPTSENNVVYNCASVVTVGNVLNWFTVNDEIEKMTLFKNDFVAAGKFTKGYNYNTGDSVTLNHIGRKMYSHTNAISDIQYIEPHVLLYPNPVTEKTITVVNDFHANAAFIFDLMGREVFKTAIENATQTLSLPIFLEGNYIITLINKEGLKKSQKLIVR